MTRTSSRGPAPKVATLNSESAHLDPILFESEDPAAYGAFRAEIHGHLHPQGKMEEILVDEYVAYHWEAVRLRRLLLKHIASCEPEALASLLESFGLEQDPCAEIVAGFASGDAAKTARAASLLSAAGHDLETIRARAVAIHSEEIGRLHGLITAAEKRRDRSVRELAAHRERMRKLGVLAAQVLHDDPDGVA